MKLIGEDNKGTHKYMIMLVALSPVKTLGSIVQRMIGMTLMECQWKFLEKTALKLRLKKIRKTRGAKIQESNGVAGLREWYKIRLEREISKSQTMGGLVGHSEELVFYSNLD